jgi:lipoyl-dependent peroxiredoxin
MRGIKQEQAEALIVKTHTICPYSKATRGNIAVKLLANGKPVEGS